MRVSLNGSLCLKKKYPQWFEKNTSLTCLLQLLRQKDEKEYFLNKRYTSSPFFLDQMVSEGEPLADLQELGEVICTYKPDYTFIPDSFSDNEVTFQKSWKVLKRYKLRTTLLAIPHGKDIEDAWKQIKFFLSHSGIKGVGIGYDVVSPKVSKETIRGELLQEVRKEFPTAYVHFLGIRDYPNVFNFGFPDSIDTSSPISQGLQKNWYPYKEYKNVPMYNKDLNNLAKEVEKCIDYNVRNFWAAMKKGENV